MTSYETITVSSGDGVMEIALNRPEVLNALNQRMAEELCDALDWASGQASVRAVLLHGQGRAFSAGGDLSAMRDARPTPAAFFETPLARIHDAALSLHRLPKPVVGAVHGFAAGAGFNLALCCDLLLCEERTLFHQAFVRIGAVPDTGGTWLLPRLVGSKRALEMFMLGEQIDAAAALSLGIVNRVLPAARLLPEARELCRKLATGPTAAYAEMKQLVARAAGGSLSEALDAEQQAQIRIGASADIAEGIRSFFEKRPPRYQGR